MRTSSVSVCHFSFGAAEEKLAFPCQKGVELDKKKTAVESEDITKLSLPDYSIQNDGILFKISLIPPKNRLDYYYT